ncbi:MAG: hypothetical protein AB8G95_25295 [Anaerolineae bacterium]
MDYNQYEATPLFSYDQSRTAIRQIKAENNRQLRENYYQSVPAQNGLKWRLLAQFGSAGVLIAGVVAAAIFS